MSRDRMTLIPLVRNRTLTLIERQFSSLFLTLYHNTMPSKGLEIHTYRLLVSQEYARC
jgi:hypothetical protein